MTESLNLLRYPFLYFSFAILLIALFASGPVPPAEYWLAAMWALFAQLVVELVRIRIRFYRRQRRREKDDAVRHQTWLAEARNLQERVSNLGSPQSNTLERILRDDSLARKTELDGMREFLENNPDPQSFRLYSKIAIRYWSRGEYNDAIGCAEKAIQHSSGNPLVEPSTSLSLKNSLAYYYAERQKPEDKSSAKGLADEVLENGQVSGARIGSAMATKGFVEIQFAETPEQVVAGLGLCIHALGTDGTASLALCERHFDKAQARLDQLKTK